MCASGLRFAATGTRFVSGFQFAAGLQPQAQGLPQLSNVPHQVSGLQPQAQGLPQLSNVPHQVSGLPLPPSGPCQLSSQSYQVSDASHTQHPSQQATGLHSGQSGSGIYPISPAQVYGFAGHQGMPSLGVQRPVLDPVTQGVNHNMGAWQVGSDGSTGPKGTTLTPETQSGRGRGEFEPGDRTFWELPKLSAVSEPNAAVRASDWLYRSALMLRDLSAKSWQWYDRVYEASLDYYRTYQEADPLKRGQIRPDLPADLQNPAFARLEARAVSMLLNSVPESVSSQALATRSLSSVGIIYQVLKQFQPGGLMERQELLKSLTELPVAGSGREAVLSLQAWFRHVAKARTMQVQLPDGSILLAALDNLSP